MSHNLELAQKHAWNLARTLMITVILFRSDNEYGVLLADELEDAVVATGRRNAPPFFFLSPECSPVRLRSWRSRTGCAVRRFASALRVPRLPWSSALFGPRDGAAIGAASRQGGS